jgi:hypothetical protein
MILNRAYAITPVQARRGQMSALGENKATFLSARLNLGGYRKRILEWEETYVPSRRSEVTWLNVLTALLS